MHMLRVMVEVVDDCLRLQWVGVESRRVVNVLVGGHYTQPFVLYCFTDRKQVNDLRGRLAEAHRLDVSAKQVRDEFEQQVWAITIWTITI